MIETKLSYPPLLSDQLVSSPQLLKHQSKNVVWEPDLNQIVETAKRRGAAELGESTAQALRELLTQLFPKFKSLQQAELAGSADIKAHGNTVISKLGDLLKQKGNHATLLRPLGESHAKKHKIPLANFKLICDVIVTVLKEKYSDFGPDSQAAMSKALDLIFAGMGPLYQEFGFAG
ncbi:UNVERIFIED_CONTAM: hypothetical protein FKN15_011373 [Acipenser sinensis]